ncbi:TIGR04141 family sporadically distributed protein [Arcanobacterium phocisimile]|uniref:TIGR04141 family sporadically distributed protein n=2 Tax=Arcanobacterium TaxID=28263 RepID=A0A6H2EK89_9ACTO|nr:MULTISPECIES: DUF6119 family protein [Arcanobacterium]QJC21221.1 TIGR04141 family sporadically distributed protein [Arcanobacterium buesumense]QRV02363.1 TIGR04141 family sporadically distributed protein [Arcanobacterium phocisimile]
MGKQRLTIYMFRENVQDIEDIFDLERKSQIGIEVFKIPTNNAFGSDGCLFYKKQEDNTPAWLSYVIPILAEDLPEMKTKSISALLVTRVKERIFAIAFGYGRSLIDLQKIEFNFGLRVALNLIDPKQIRSVDTKLFDDLVLSAKMQVSRDAGLASFNVDTQRDILKSVAGKIDGNDFFNTISGSDSVVLNADIGALKVPRLLEQLLEAYQSEAYKKNFGWVDHLALVRDEKTINLLDNKLVGELRSGVLGSTHLALPDVLDLEDIDAYKIQGTRGVEYPELDLDSYLKELGDALDQLSLEKLKRFHVSVRFSRTQAYDRRGTLYRCLVSEQRLEQGGRLYVLIEGRWFEVDKLLVEEVDSYLEERITFDAKGFPDAKVGEKETNYNQRLVRESGGGLLLLDAKVFRPQGARTGIEFCDVLSKEGEIIHVKRKSRSSTLSHLFAQGTVSAKTFLGDQSFRSELRDYIRDQVKVGHSDDWSQVLPDMNESVVPNRYCIRYLIIAKSSRTGMDWLPFFSKITLIQNTKELLQMGYKVTVGRVSVSD